MNKGGLGGEPERINAFSRNRKHRLRRRLLAAAAVSDSFAILLAFLLASLVRGGEPDGDQVGSLGALTLVLYGAFGLNNRAFSFQTLSSYRAMVGHAVRSLATSLLFVMLVLFVAKLSEDYSRLAFFLAGFCGLVFLVAVRTMLFTLVKKLLPNGPAQDLVIHDFDEPTGDPNAIDARALGLNPDPGDLNCVAHLTAVASPADRLIVHCEPERRLAWATMLKTLTIHAEIGLPELNQLQPLAVQRRNGQVMAVISENPLSWYQSLTKRASDVTLTLLAMPVVLPIMAAIAVAIKLDSQGPVFFRQVRMGYANQPFRVIKFRSMRVETTDTHGTRSTDRDDERVTRVGRFIRRTSLDELPQLLNVLQGDMSLVGPRPHALGSTAGGRLFWQVNHAYWVRHRIKPGLTGLAQVRGFRGSTFAEDDLQNRLVSDLEYLSNWSLWRDVRILLLTLKAVRNGNAF